MTGREHYEEAERLLEIADEVGCRVGAENAHAVAAQAQVHATLALAATQSAFCYGATRAFGEAIDDRDPWATPPISTPSVPENGAT